MVEEINAGIALFTCIGSVCLFLMCLVWFWKLVKSNTTDFGWWFLGTAILALALASWSLKGIRLAIDPDRGLPTDTLFERTAIMTAVWIKVWIGVRRKPMPRWKGFPALRKKQIDHPVD